MRTQQLLAGDSGRGLLPRSQGPVMPAWGETPETVEEIGEPLAEGPSAEEKAPQDGQAEPSDGYVNPHLPAILRGDG